MASPTSENDAPAVPNETVATEQQRPPTPPATKPASPIPTPTVEISPPEDDGEDKEDTVQTPVNTNGSDHVEEEGDREDKADSDVEVSTPVAERPLPPQPDDEVPPIPPKEPETTVQESEVVSTTPAPVPDNPPAVISHDADVAAPSPQAVTPSPTSQPSPNIPHSPQPPQQQHRGSVSATSFNAARGNPVSVVLIASALETIVASKEAKRSPQLKDSATSALEMIRNGQGGDRPREIFEPLRLACETKSEKLMIASLDCISKLISYSFFAENVSPAQALSSASPPPSPTTGNSQQPSPHGNMPMSLADLVTNTITSAYTESTPDTVSLQIVKALLALVLSNTILVHHSSLLKAVRTVYNVFLLSQDPVNQMVAQGGLTQMVNHVFSRAKVGSTAAGFAASDSPVTPATADVVSDIQARLAREGVILPKRKNSRPPTGSAPGTPTLQADSFRLSMNGSSTAPQSEAGDDAESAAGDAPESNGMKHVPSSSSGKETPEAANGRSGTPSTPLKIVTTENGSNRASPGLESSSTRNSVVGTDRHITTNDLFIKDAFLVFRALCKLTMKSLNNESERDIKSHAMRSKLLSLQLVLQILNDHMPLFVEPSSIIYSSSSDERHQFLQAAKQYLCLSLSRNAVSPVTQVFEISVEIFWRVLMGMRTKLKKEIEVLLNEIFLPILEMRNSTLRQKSVLLSMLYRLSQDPQALVEIYLNYDCDRDATENIYERLVNKELRIKLELTVDALRLMNIISKMCTTHFNAPVKSTDPNLDTTEAPSAKNQKAQLGPTFPASPNTTTLGGKNAQDSVASTLPGFTEPKLKRQSLEALVAVLRSLVVWGTGAAAGAIGAGSGSALGTTSRTSTLAPMESESGLDSARMSSEDTRTEDVPSTAVDSASARNSMGPFRATTPDPADDPSRFETAKQHKTTLLEGIRKFNFKSKRGVQFLLETGFIKSREPIDIARFLLETDGLSKTMIGEYLGEGDDENVAIMHAFVDLLDFTELPFVDALRLFLQSFRLPGEAQKIDRYMLKFAERYVGMNAQTAFANADAAYVLAYSTIMLNTDAYNPQVKNRMTKADFVKNNRGINDGANLPEEFLGGIYDDIYSNEIRMKDEVEAAALAAPVPASGLAGALANVGRDLQKEAYVMQSTGMANKTEALFKSMMRAQRKGGSKSSEQFFSASHSIHVRPMFEVAWMSFLAGISGPLQDTDDLEIVELCLDGFKSAIRIVCVFDIELERNAFVTTLAKFTFLNNLGEMKAKNMEAIKTLLDVAVTEGNHLKGSWHEVLTCVSQLERMQLISNGIDVPDSGRPSNPHVAFFALDALRQLAMRFLEKEELPHFKFQKDFLKPFEYAMVHNQNPEVRDMILQCLQQMIQLRVQNMRSGWRTMFGVFSAASKVLTERVANAAFEIVTRLNKDHFSEIVRHGSFADLTVCITDFCKVSKYQKISLLAIGMLRGVIPTMLASPDTHLSSTTTSDPPLSPRPPEMGHAPPVDDPMIRFWFPTLFSFYDIIMNGEDLEVRRLALDSLFSTLKTYGHTYPVDFWDTVCQELLFPIFAVLRSSQDMSRFSTQEDMSVWLSTTMIQALRNLIDLYTYYFDILERTLDGLLDLLVVCICQENDTLARIGTSCFQQLLENNAKKLSSARWERVVKTFVRLFKTTTPHQLFDETLRMEIGENGVQQEHHQDGTESPNGRLVPAPLSPSQGTKPTPGELMNDRRRTFKQIIVKCVLQLLLIETTNDLLHNDDVYKTIPPEHLLQLMKVLDHSYQFARSFNADKELRTGLWKVGFMKHLPNLLKQESSSAATLVNVLSRMYYDKRPAYAALQNQVGERLIPLGLGVIQDFISLNGETQAKNIAAWTPVVAEVLNGFAKFDDQSFLKYLPGIYQLATELLSRDLAPELRDAVRRIFVRAGQVHGIMLA
ncbi:guanine nucleotide exchange protein for ADP-robosylation factor [Tulasnella sp. 403]|nr:guanine nucleotide exchange protein for ADP-robosylation factor [Tulasnella sp. 403]